MGKIRAEGHGEVQEMIDICDFAVGLSRQLYGLTHASERPGHRMIEQWHPLGPVGVITAFNFPGRGVVVERRASPRSAAIPWSGSRPSRRRSRAIAVQHIANRVMADHGVTGIFTLVVGPGRIVGERMLNDPRLPLISFTGSTAVGRHVAEVVAARLGRTILELGGNNAIIVTEDADLDLATRAILFGAVGTAGQRCTSTRRIIVHKSDLPSDLIATAASRRTRRCAIGDPLDAGTLMGPLVDAAGGRRHVRGARRRRWPRAARCSAAASGGRTSGRSSSSRRSSGCRRRPTIVKHETFAPILYLLEYDDFDEAIAHAQRRAAGPVERDLHREHAAAPRSSCRARGSDCGIANVNIGTSGAEIGGAFGGEKETGGGRESGSDAWKAYMRRQTNTVNWSDALPLAQGITFGE